LVIALYYKSRQTLSQNNGSRWNNYKHYNPKDYRTGPGEIEDEENLITSSCRIAHILRRLLSAEKQISILKSWPNPARHQWLTSIILAFWEAKIWKTAACCSRQNVHETLSLPIAGQSVMHLSFQVTWVAEIQRIGALASQGQIVCKTQFQCKKNECGTTCLLSQLWQEAKIGGSWSQLTWAKSKTLSPKYPPPKRGCRHCPSGRATALQSQSPQFKHQYCQNNNKKPMDTLILGFPSPKVRK
jgi:hypothetical protein